MSEQRERMTPADAHGEGEYEAKGILVVGDWVVDDHWVTSIHRSPTASRTGRAHHRSLHRPDNTVQALCGAGRTASILHEALVEDKQFCEVVGIGVWHPADTNALATMLDPKANIGKTPFRIDPRFDPSTSRSQLLNLVDVLPQDLQRNSGTSRMIRIYQSTGPKIELLERVDWELPAPFYEDNLPVWITRQEGGRLDALVEKFDKDKIDAIVVKDLCKGVVSQTMLAWLTKHFKTKKWFVSTKAWPWIREGDSDEEALLMRLSQLAEVDLRLLLIPQVPAQSGVRKGELSCWITESGHPSKQTLDLLDKLANDTGMSNSDQRTIIVALPEGRSVVAREANPTLRGLVQPNPRPSRFDLDVAMASVFLPALVAKLLWNPEIELQTLLGESLAFTEQWMAKEIGRVATSEYGTPHQEHRLLVTDPAQRSDPYTWREIKWDMEILHWDKAFERFGILEINNEERIELWRAMVDLSGYVCCVESKRKVIRQLTRELNRFRMGPREEHVSCIISSPPGSGKSALVRQLAKSFDMRFLPFNVTQMTSRTDIIDCFDTIATTQAHAREEPGLVFVDEINAELGGQTVYDAFLAPLQEGSYMRGGKFFKIDPCAWVFAGTEDPRNRDRTKSQKASDFEQRLTLDPLELESEPGGDDPDRLEKVYLGVALIKSAFPDVGKVTEKILALFHSLPVGFATRDLEHLVKSFTDVQYGKVYSRNVAANWIEKLKNDKNFDLGQWRDRQEGPVIKVVS